MKCRDILTASDVPVNFIEPPARVDFTGRGNFTVTKLHNTCPETHFQCPGEGYCLPVYVRCNRVNDCPGKEDEKNCDHYTCPGFYRCRHSKICLHRQHLCDGVFQCPQHDDEWLCNVTCPDTCHCYGHAFICTGSFTTDTYPELRYVDASGMIQTFGWSRYTGYPFMDSCVKLHVPENHVAMISLVSIDLDLQRNQMDCADYFFIDNSGKCSAHDDNINAICQMQDLRPTVINGHMILSFRFKSDRGSFWLKPGFRLLYSFHKNSEEPEQLPDGQWNCSVPYYASFQMHFVCMFESFCSDRSIEVKCPQHEGMCGFKSFPFGGSCYRFMKPAQRTWVDASDACVHYGGRLAVFNTASTWTNTSAFLQEINPAKRSLFIGLKMAPSVTLPEM
ncbi:hypothetical protein ACOMHN_037083 [Nucella lapillus]